MEDIGGVLGLGRRQPRLAGALPGCVCPARDQPDQDRVAPAAGPHGPLHVLRRPSGQRARAHSGRGAGGAARGVRAGARAGLLPGRRGPCADAASDAPLVPPVTAGRGKRTQSATFVATLRARMDTTIPPDPVRSVPPPEHRRRGPESGRVLVLNATFEPINVCSVRRAVVLLLKEKAELVERGRWELHSEKTTLARPAVIRLVTYVRVPRDAHQRKITRRAVFARDGWTCQYCGVARKPHRGPRDPPLQGGAVELGEHRGVVRAVQPPQGRPAATPGRHAAAPRAQSAARGGVHPRRQPVDPGGVAPVPAADCPGCSDRHARAAYPDAQTRGRRDEGAPRDAPRTTDLTGRPRLPALPEGPGPAAVSGCPGLDSATRSSLPT